MSYFDEQRRLGNPDYLEPNELNHKQLKEQIEKEMYCISSWSSMVERSQFRLANLRAELLKPKLIIQGGGKVTRKKKFIEQRIRKWSEQINEGESSYEQASRKFKERSQNRN